MWTNALRCRVFDTTFPPLPFPLSPLQALLLRRPPPPALLLLQRIPSLPPSHSCEMYATPTQVWGILIYFIILFLIVISPSLISSSHLPNLLSLSSSSDTGILTLILCSKVPGLQIWDAKNKHWLEVEKHLIGKYKSGSPRKHLVLCIVGEKIRTFTSSHALTPTLHRVVYSPPLSSPSLLPPFPHPPLPSLPSLYQFIYFTSRWWKKGLRGRLCCILWILPTNV